MYARAGVEQCVKCEPLYLQLLKFFGIFVMLVSYIVYLLYSILSNPRRNKPQTVLLRIITNYFQAVMIAKEFNLQWP